jgi:DNA polymerase alpha subunit A
MLRYDPDVLVGHDLIGDHMEIILQRLKELKIEHWSRIGRLRRSKKIALGKQGTNVRLVMGRLVCDLTSDAAKVRPFSRLAGSP